MRVLHQGEGLVAVDKPAGLPTEPTRDPARPNVLSALRAQWKLNESEFLAVPHRLDRDTSGVLLIARTKEALAALNKAFAERRARKIYVALVHGTMLLDEGRIESFLASVGKREGIEAQGAVRSGGKKAITTYRVLERRGGLTLVECELETGRTHQARVHMAELGHPLVGDELYGAPAGEHARVGRHMLHARLIEIQGAGGYLPAMEGLIVESELPGEFRTQMSGPV